MQMEAKRYTASILVETNLINLVYIASFTWFKMELLVLSLLFCLCFDRSCSA